MTTNASPPTTDEREDEVDAAQVMLARVGATTFAVPAAQLREVTRARSATRVPGTPAWIQGIAVMRGTLVPVADLVRRTDDADVGDLNAGDPNARDAGDGAWLALVEHEGRSAAVGVSGFDGVFRVAAELTAASRTSDALPRRGAVRLASEGVAEPGDAREVDLLDVGALFDQLFDGE